MDDNSYIQMANFFKKMLQQNPENENYQKMLELLIHKKSEYDLERLKSQKEAYINERNNYYNFCMQNMNFKYQWMLLSNGYKNVPFSDL